MRKALPPDLAAPAAEALADALDPALKALSSTDLGPLIAEGQIGTVFATLNGVPVAMVPLELYRRLVSAAFAGTAPAAAPRQPVRPARNPVRTSTIDRDPEVAAFLRERFEQHQTIDALREACIARFGHARTPSRTRITILRQRSR